MNEKILCAAIWYKEEFEKEAPFNPKNVDEGVVLCGWRHPSIISQMSALTGRRTPTMKHIQGFLTSDNRFVDRNEAAIIAYKAEQVDWTEIDYKHAELYSEDIY